MNISEIDLGDNLRAFKEFTRDFSPALRGDAIANFDFVKSIHNSFARSVFYMTQYDIQITMSSWPFTITYCILKL